MKDRTPETVEIGDSGAHRARGPGHDIVYRLRPLAFGTIGFDDVLDLRRGYGCAGQIQWIEEKGLHRLVKGLVCEGLDRVAEEREGVVGVDGSVEGGGKRALGGNSREILGVSAWGDALILGRDAAGGDIGGVDGWETEVAEGC